MLSSDLSSKFSQINLNMREFSERTVYEFENFRLDADALLLFRDGEQLSLTPKVVATLLALVERPGEVVTKDNLMEIVWPDTQVEEGNLTQNLYLLRKTLGIMTDGRPFFETLRRRGYRFQADVAVARNGTSAAKIAQPASAPLATSRSLRVERQGNVLAVTEWLESEPEAAPAPVVAPAQAGSGSRPTSKTSVIVAVSVVFIAIAAATLAFLWTRFSADRTSAKSDVTFTALTAGANVDFASISPDGNYFAYASNEAGRGHLWVQQTGQMNPVEITDPISGFIFGTSWTPDSRHIYFVTNEEGKELNTLYRVPALGGTRTKILTNVGTQVSFSPDGGEIVFMRGSVKDRKSSIVIAASDGSSERILLTRTFDENVALYGGGSWSPDGKTIAYGVVDTKQPWTGGCTIVGTDIASGETKPLSDEKWDNCYRMEWTKDSKGLVFVGTRANEAFSTRRDQVYYLSLDTGESRRITTDGNRHQNLSLGVTEKDEILAVPFNRLSQIWALDASGDSRTATQITTGFADGRSGIAPLADGRVSYLTRHGDGFSIWLMNADGSNRKQLTTDPPNIQELHSSVDGRFMVFSAKRDGWDHLYRVDHEGDELTQLTFGESAEDDSSISPDGAWIVFDSNRFINGELDTRLYRIPSIGGQPSQLTEAECSNPHYSPNGKFISCVSADWKTMLIISAEDGKVLNSFKTEPNCVLNIGSRWAPDSVALLYITTRNNVSNIVRQSVDGRKPAPLTDFTSGEIYNFAFSVDGSRLYLARGYSTRNAMLLKIGR